jgi:hypothetical protein
MFSVFRCPVVQNDGYNRRERSARRRNPNLLDGWNDWNGWNVWNHFLGLDAIDKLLHTPAHRGVGKSPLCRAGIINDVFRFSHAGDGTRHGRM